MYRFTIFNEKIQEVQTVLADTFSSDGSMVGFITDGQTEMIYNLPAGYSILKEDA